MEESASSTIIQGTLITSGISAFITGLYGISRKNPKYGFLAVAAGVNSGVTAFTFFAIRESLIGPLLVHTLPWPQYARRRRELDIGNTAEGTPLPELTWSDLRQHKTLDTGISGLLAGGLLRGWRSGPRAIVPGALTIGAIGTILQLAYNELGITRLRYISGLNGGHSSPLPSMPTSSERPPGGVLALLGVREVSDEEYIAKMKSTKEGYLKRIAELEQQIMMENSKK